MEGLTAEQVAQAQALEHASFIGRIEAHIPDGEDKERLLGILLIDADAKLASLGISMPPLAEVFANGVPSLPAEEPAPEAPAEEPAPAEEAPVA